MKIYKMIVISTLITLPVTTLVSCGGSASSSEDNAYSKNSSSDGYNDGNRGQNTQSTYNYGYTSGPSNTSSTYSWNSSFNQNHTYLITFTYGTGKTGTATYSGTTEPSNMYAVMAAESQLRSNWDWASYNNIRITTITKIS